MWAKTSGYSATFYHRPCKVLSVWGDIITVKVLDSSFTYEVEATKFELAPLRAILETGDKPHQAGPRGVASAFPVPLLSAS